MCSTSTPTTRQGDSGSSSSTSPSSATWRTARSAADRPMWSSTRPSAPSSRRARMTGRPGCFADPAIAPIRQRVLDARRVRYPGRQIDHRHSEIGAGVGEVARSVLVVMGGTDPVGLAPAAVRLLAGTGLVLDVTVIAVGGIAERVRAAAEGSSLSLSVLAPVDDLAATDGSAGPGDQRGRHLRLGAVLHRRADGPGLGRGQPA